MIESSLSQGMYSGQAFPKYVECTCAFNFVTVLTAQGYAVKATPKAACSCCALVFLLLIISSVTVLAVDNPQTSLQIDCKCMQNRPPGHPRCCTACMRCSQLLYTVKTGHCKPHVIGYCHALINIAVHCSQPLYTFKTGHCRPHVYQGTVSPKTISLLYE